MIDEAVLERLLRDEAATYVPPPDGPDRILGASRATARRAPRRRAPWLAAAAAAAVVVAVGVPLAGNGLPSPASFGSRTSLDQGGELAYKDSDGGAGGSAGSGANQTGGKLGSQLDAKVVRTGDVSLEVPKARVGETVAAAGRVAAKHGGYVSESSSETAGEHPVGSVTIRVPVAAFDAAFEELRGLGEVRHSGVRGADVTAEVTDVAARLRSLTATRTQLETLLARAKDVGEVLAVQQRMTEVQTEIEQLQGRQKALADSTSFGTLQVVVQPPDAGSKSGFAKAWHDAVNGFVGGFEWLVAALGPIAFALLVGGVLLVLGRRAYRYWVRGVV